MKVKDLSERKGAKMAEGSGAQLLNQQPSSHQTTQRAWPSHLQFSKAPIMLAITMR